MFVKSTNYHLLYFLYFFLQNCVRFPRLMCIYSRGAYNTVRSEQRHLRPCSAVLFKRFTPSYIYAYKSSIPCLYPSQYALSFSTVLVYFISASLCILFTMFSRLSTFSLLLLLFRKSLKLRSL